MYYKKQGIQPPVIKRGSVYKESYLFDGYLYLKYQKDNVPLEPLEEITREEYEINKPVIPEPPTPEPTNMELLMQANSDAELRDLEIQQGQEMLAQQMTDIELAMLGGN